MALPTITDLKKMDIAYQGQPFVYVPAKNTIILRKMDYAYQAQPFVANSNDTVTIRTPSPLVTHFR